MKWRLPATLTTPFNENSIAAGTRADIPSSVTHATSADAEKQQLSHVVNNDYGSDSDEDSLRKVDLGAQHGTQQAQAEDQLWSRRDLIVAFVLIWLIEFVLAFGNGITGTLTTYVTSGFGVHSLLALTSVLSSLIAGLFKLPYAKIMDIWGRPQALALGVFLITIGAIMMAAMNTVETYCAAQVFYWMGYNCIDLSVTVFIADHTKLKNRGFLLAFTFTPFLITTWVYGFAVNDIVFGSTGIRWGFGIFAIIIPLVCAPWMTMLFLKQSKAKKLGLSPPRKSMTVIELLKEFDVAGLLILCVGLALFLLAFNLYSYQTERWASPMIISFLVIGFVLIVCFVAYERFVAPVTFIPWGLLKNRTVVFTYVMAASFYTTFYIWDTYFYSCLIVLFNQPVLYATYILNIYTLGSCFISVVYGIALRYYGKLKIYAMIWGVPLTILGVGLMIHFRQPDVNIGYIVMCQLFVAFGGGVLVISEQVTLMAVSRQRDFPALLAVEATVIAIGSAVGQTIAGAMWTGIFPVKLAQNLPANAQADLFSIYGDIQVQSSYAIGSPTRDAINQSYGETQGLMLIAATCLLSITLIAVVMWEDVDVTKSAATNRAASISAPVTAGEHDDVDTKH